MAPAAQCPAFIDWQFTVRIVGMLHGRAMAVFAFDVHMLRCGMFRILIFMTILAGFLTLIVDLKIFPPVDVVNVVPAVHVSFFMYSESLWHDKRPYD
jgi:hypothetical protein